MWSLIVCFILILITFFTYQALPGTSLIHGKRNFASGPSTTENVLKVYCWTHISSWKGTHNADFIIESKVIYYLE